MHAMLIYTWFLMVFIPYIASQGDDGPGSGLELSQMEVETPMDDKNSVYTADTLKYGEFPVDSGDEEDSRPALQTLKAFVWDPEDDTEEVPTPSLAPPGLPPVPVPETPAAKNPEGVDAGVEGKEPVLQHGSCHHQKFGI